MNHRIYELYGLSAALSADQVIPIDLDMVDPISQIIIDARVTHGVDADTTEHPIAFITKIEIVDGSDVLFSLDGFETEALDIYDNGLFPRGGWFNYLTGDTTDRQIALNFGRYLWDEELALVPPHFKNPKLNISIDYDAGGMSPASVRLSVLANLFDEKSISPSGFLMTKEVKKWTKTAAGHEYTDMPLDFPYRKLLLQSRYAGIPPHWIFNNIKLASDQDKKVILNGEFRDLMFGIGRENAFIEEILTGRGNVGTTIGHCTPTMDVMGVGNAWINLAPTGYLSTYNGDGGQYEWYSSVAQNTVHHIKGWAPHGTLCIPFGKQGVIDDWFNLGGIGSLKLDVTSGHSTATQKLFIQQLRSY